jgi:hypothetical protein
MRVAPELNVKSRVLTCREKANMLWTVLVVLVILWVLGLGLNAGGSLIHLLLAVAVVVLFVNLINRSRRAV